MVSLHAEQGQSVFPIFNNHGLLLGEIMVATQNTRLPSSVDALKRELWLRLFFPIEQFSFLAYVFLAIIVFGGVAIWVELYKYTFIASSNADGIKTAIGTYFPAVGCAAAFQLACAEEEKKYLRSFGWIASFGFVFWSFWLLRGGAPTSAYSLASGVIASCLAILMWWVANALDESFHDKVDYESIVGGPADASPSGDTTGFRT